MLIVVTTAADVLSPADDSHCQNSCLLVCELIAFISYVVYCKMYACRLKPSLLYILTNGHWLEVNENSRFVHMQVVK